MRIKYITVLVRKHAPIPKKPAWLNLAMSYLNAQLNNVFVKTSLGILGN